MKRYILKLALLALSTTALVSCDEDTVTYGGQNFVSFDGVASTRYNAFENIGVAEIPVNLAFPKSNDVIVNFDITDSQGVEGVDYVVLTPGSVTIPAGQTTAYIRIQITNNDILNDSKALNITLTGLNDSDVALGLLDTGSKMKRFLIVNDDCTTNFLEFVRQYNVENGGIVIGTAVADVNDNGDCNILRLSGTLDTYTGGTDPGVYIDVTLAPAGGNKNVGTISSFPQTACAKCFGANGISNDASLQISGSFSNNVNTGVKQLIINAAIFIPSSDQSQVTTSVTLKPIN